MRAENLKRRLQDSATELRNIVNSLSLITAPSLPSGCINEIRKFDGMANQLTAIATAKAVEP